MFRTLEIRLAKLLIASGKCFNSTKTCETTVNETPFLQQLSAEFNDVSSIASVIKEENLDKIKLSEWKDRIQFLQTYNFKHSECFHMIKSYPNILKMPFGSLKYATQQWSECNLGVDNFKKLLSNQPQFLDLNLVEITEKIPNLNVFFPSKKSLVSLLIRCPNIMYDDWEYTQAKIEYLTKKKGVNIGQLFESNALSYTLFYIKLRISVLEKCGVFIPRLLKPHKVNKYDKSQHQNPHLKDVLDADDKFFSKTIARITLEEYIVCSELFSSDQFDNPISDSHDEQIVTDVNDDDDYDLSLNYKKRR